jgi:hypothetical protein
MCVSRSLQTYAADSEKDPPDGKWHVDCVPLWDAEFLSAQLLSADDGSQLAVYAGVKIELQ